MVSAFEKLSYRLSQRLRAGWFSTHYAATARLSPPASPASEADKRAFPSAKAVSEDLGRLFARDWANIEAGLYAAPEGQWPNPLKVIGKSRQYFRDLRNVNQRKAARDGREVAAKVDQGRFPDYYLQNFHFQSDGYLSANSAELYDYQVEVLFTGGADAMRRQALVPIGDALGTRDIRQARLLDLACGTGQFLAAVKQNYPRLRVTGLDLSPPYLQKAEDRLAPWSRHTMVQGAGEFLPFADASFDVVSCIYLFHELPRPVRRQVAMEIRRVLKPNGRLVFVDSLQPGDHPPFDVLLHRFPQATHEPYYADYLEDDLEDLFEQAGFAMHGFERAFFSRLMDLAPRE
ncbi:MAG: ubiquinone biosynthesis methyltransferase UbiE [Rhodospirillaceae bacterium]|nr:ubiquinone biosynthesis methyltransferase UbiE [Rhodospirillaceae bacterium]